ncbi:Glycosyl hydrolase family 63, C-terminal [Fusarium oxysporum f. sp. vasinfectum]|nr:Glycosyl hydrolase family 63, C-terminal [Fusarium oxysporum f. sp. vasinfectum]
MVKIAHWVSAATLALGVSAADDASSVLTTEIGRQNNQSLFWGPYKSNLYFGVRPRTPDGLWTGLMWGKVDNYHDIQNGFRYTCEQGEDMHGYGWDEYDARIGGVQSIHDKGNNIDLTTTFVKIPGGNHGGSWAARIRGELRDGAPKNTRTMLFYYIAQDGDGELAVEGEGTKYGFKDDVTLKGSSKALGDYKLLITKGTGEHPSTDHKFLEDRHGDTTIVSSTEVPADLTWQGKPVVFKQLQDAVSPVQQNADQADPPPPWQVYRIAHAPGKGNVHIVEKTFEGRFEFDVIFSSESGGKEFTSEEVTEQIEKTSEIFNERFTNTFKLKEPFTQEKYKKFGKSMLSNLIGGIGYFHGHQLIDRSYAPEYEEQNDGFWEEAAQAKARTQPELEGPYELFTSVPSRPFLPPRLPIVKSWYNTMDEDGWIAREQILGHEARSKVPPEFQVQFPHYANPPTLFLIIEGFMERLRASNGTKSEAKERILGADPLQTAHLDNIELGENYLRKLYPLLRQQYDWFRKTQRGDIKNYDREAYSTKEAYRWRGRTETHILTSGLDDYPRPQPPSPGELHVDLMSWVGLMTKSLMNIADALGMAEDVNEYRKNLDGIEHNLNDLHWSDEDGCYCDATIDDYEEHALVCHKGYISLFPFLVGLMKADDPKLGKILDLVGDEEHLWSPHGIRSLSKKDEFYATGENYWRSPVWMPINYLALSQLQNVASQEGPYRGKAKDLFTRLRKNLVDTVYKSWEETGFAWEQYNPDTGAGQRTQHFTGWTSLVVKIMAMEDPSQEAHAKDEL